METLFVGCFAFGLIFTVASFALGAFGGGHDLHLPGFDAHELEDRLAETGPRGFVLEQNVVSRVELDELRIRNARGY